MPRLENQVAVVTGGGRGFGRAIALAFAEEGASVVVTARTADQLEETVRQIKEKGGKAHAVVGDVTVAGDVERVKRETEAQFGPASLLVNNAGVPWPFGPTWHVDVERWWQAQSTHVRAAMLHIHAFVPGMIERGAGRVIVVSSGIGRSVRANLSGYGVAKATQIRLTQFLAEEARLHGVYAFSIGPGFVLTEFANTGANDPDAQKFMPEWADDMRKRFDAGEDISEGLAKAAGLCVNLASGDFDVLSGEFLSVTDDLAALAAAAEADGAKS
jgi:NAD(P)-dependent dehydrogenase (short-subunit alcohol dehydrogenase family)